VYRCLGDERWCAIRVESQAQLDALRGIVGPALDVDHMRALDVARANHDAFDAIVSAWTAQREAAAVMTELQEHGVPAGLVASGDDLLADPQLDRLGFIRHLDQPGVGPMVVPGLPLTIEPPILSEPAPAALLGADTDDVLRTILSLRDDEIATLRENGALR
jgi:crotonobetainyl-CoA:carnitine CoA-transferase CaiB-like acyl-CoA transferase